MSDEPRTIDFLGAGRLARVASNRPFIADAPQEFRTSPQNAVTCPGLQLPVCGAIVFFDSFHDKSNVCLTILLRVKKILGEPGYAQLGIVSKWRRGCSKCLQGAFRFRLPKEAYYEAFTTWLCTSHSLCCCGVGVHRVPATGNSG